MKLRERISRPVLKVLVEVSRKQVEQACQAFLSAFNYDQLEEFLYFKLEKELGEIAPSNAAFSSVCFKLVRQAERDGWLVDLIRAAIDYKQGNPKLNDLAQELRIEIDNNSTARSIAADTKRTDTRDPLVVIEDFIRDLKEIPADQSWNSEDYEHELERLETGLPGLRTKVRLLAPKNGTDLKQSVLLELQLEDAIENALDSINAFELCLSYLLDSPYSRGILDRTRYVQWFRSRSAEIVEGLSSLQHLGDNPRESAEKAASSEAAAASLSVFIERLRESHVTDAARLDERGSVMTTYSGIDASLNAVIEYLNGTDVPEQRNIKVIRELLINVSGFIEHTALAQKQPPPTPRNEPLFPPSEGTRLQKICTEAVDSLDLYYRINRELISSWEESVLSGVGGRTAEPGLYQARRRFIGKLINLQRRIAALKY